MDKITDELETRQYRGTLSKHNYIKHKDLNYTLNEMYKNIKYTDTLNLI